MYIILPSGKRIDFPYDIYYPPFYSDSSVSAWFISFLLWEIGGDYPIRSIDELEDTTPELIKVLNDAGILNLNWNDYDKWNQYEWKDDHWEEIVRTSRYLS